MINDPQLMAALIGFVGAIIAGAIGSLITVWAMLRIQRETNTGLENDEIRKRRVQIIYDLLGSRYVMSDNYDAAACEVQVFNTAMAAFSVYFANDRASAEAYDRFMNSKTDDNLTSMLNMAAKTAKLNLLDTHLKRVLTVPAKYVQISMDASQLPGRTHAGGGRT